MILLLSLVASFGLGGCGSSDSEPGSPCRDDLTCGGGLVCNFQAETPTCLAPEEDLDGDGLLNGDDRCPASNEASNHDEDGDGQGDACDSCPIERFRKGTVDFDKDKLSGQCDPDDRSPGDKLIYFQPFVTATALDGWTLDDAAHFSVADGALKVTVTAADNVAEAKRALSTNATALAVFAAYRVTDAAPAGVDGTSREIGVGLYDPAPAAGGQPVRCATVVGGGTPQLRVTSGSGEASEPLLSALAVGEPYRMLMQTAGPNARCVQIRGESATAASTTGTGDLLIGLSLTMRSVFANYEYVLVVSSPADR